MLKLRERVLVLEHPDTLTSLYNLALCLEKQNKLEDAREFARHAMEGGRTVLGTAHPYTKEYGSLGQRQNGVDVYGTNGETRLVEGVQCKNTKTLSAKVVK